VLYFNHEPHEHESKMMLFQKLIKKAGKQEKIDMLLHGLISAFLFP